MRMLLECINAPSSFKDPGTIKDVEHGTYKEACVALELCKEDKQWESCLDKVRKLAEMFRALLNLLFFGISRTGGAG